MSKKYKRQVRKEKLASTTTDTASPVVSTTSTAASPRLQSTSQPAFNPDYTYVIKDLRRIGLLVGTFVTILIILSFILR